MITRKVKMYFFCAEWGNGRQSVDGTIKVNVNLSLQGVIEQVKDHVAAVAGHRNFALTAFNRVS